MSPASLGLPASVVPLDTPRTTFSSAACWVGPAALAALLALGLPAKAAAQRGGVGAQCVSCTTYAVSVTPDGGSASATAMAPGNTTTFTVTNTGSNNTSTYGLTCSGYTCTVSPTQVTLAAGAPGQNVTVTYTAGPAGVGTLSLTAQDLVHDAVLDGGSRTVTATGPGLPTIAAAHNSTYRNEGLCVASCFDVLYQYYTPTYVSLGSPRGLGLIYNSSTHKPTPMALIDAGLTPYATSPTTYRVQLFQSTGAAITLLNGSTSAYFGSTSAPPSRLAAAFDAKANSMGTGAYDIKVIVTAIYPTASLADSATVRVLIDDESGSAFGAGMSLSGLQRLYSVAGGYNVIITEADGSVVFYARSCGTCAFLTPGGASAALTYVSATSTYRRTALDGSYIEFNARGRMTKAVDRFGNTTTLTWVGTVPNDSILTTITDPQGKTLSLCYGSNCGASGKLFSLRVLSGPAVRTSNVLMDGSGRVIRIQDPDSLADSLIYNGSGLLSAIANRARKQTDFTYDGANRLATAQAPSIPLFDGTSGRPTVTTSSFESVMWQPTVAGTSSGSPKTAVRPDTVRARITDPLGAVTTIGVDRFGAPTSIVDALSQTTTITRDTASRITRVVDPVGRTTTSTYAGFLRTQSTDATFGGTYTFTYNATNDLIRVDGSTPRLDYLYYNGTNGGPSGALMRVYVGGTSATSTSVTGGQLVAWHRPDQQGRDTAVVDSLGHGSHYTFDATWGNLWKVKDADNNLTTLHFDAVGRVDSIYAPHGQRSGTLFGTMDQVQQSRDPLGQLTTFNYDSLFQLARLVDPIAQVYKYGYNAAGQLVAQFDVADTTKADSQYNDLAGNVRKVRRRSGNTVSFSYDAVGRLLTRSGTGVVVDSFRYATNGLWRVAVNANGYDSTVVDTRGRTTLVKQVLGPRTYTTTFGYDSYDRLTSRSLTQSTSGYTSTMTYVYASTAGQTLDSVCTNGKCVSFRRRGDQTVDTVVYNRGTGNAWKITQAYDSSHALRQQDYGPAGLNAFDITYTRDSLQRVLTRTSPVPGYVTRGYAYDADGQLTQAYDSNATVMNVSPRYAYDGAGNRYWWGTAAVYGPGNRPISVYGSGVFSHDVNGNMTCNASSGTPCTPGLGFVWDSIGRLTQAANAGTPVGKYYYDALGRRVRKWTASGTEYYVYLGDHIIMDVDSATNAVKAEYAWLPGADNLLAMKSGSVTAAAIRDPDNGTIRGLADFTTGAAIKQYGEWMWGETAADTGLKVRYRFAGRELDPETGLYYMRARYYHAGIGRFISEDPAGIAGGVNLYKYAGNDPVNGRDPSGMGDSDGSCRMVLWIYIRRVNGVIVDAWLSWEPECDGGGGGPMDPGGDPAGPGGGGGPGGNNGASHSPNAPRPPSCTELAANPSIEQGAAVIWWRTTVDQREHSAWVWQPSGEYVIGHVPWVPTQPGTTHGTFYWGTPPNLTIPAGATIFMHGHLRGTRLNEVDTAVADRYGIGIIAVTQDSLSSYFPESGRGVEACAR